MSFVCDVPATFTKGATISNVTGTTTTHGKLHVNSTIDVSDVNVVNNLVVQSLNIYDKLVDLSNNGGGAVDGALSFTSTNPVQNKVITNGLNSKQDIIVDLSSSGFLSAGSNVTLDVCGSNVTVNASSGGSATYFVCYMSDTSVTMSGNNYPRTIPFNQIVRQYPSTGTITDGGYEIQQSGTYWLHGTISADLGGYSAQFVISLTRNSVSTNIVYYTQNAMDDCNIIYECQVDDIIKLVCISGPNQTIFYGTGNTTGLNLNTVLQGYLLG